MLQNKPNPTVHGNDSFQSLCLVISLPQDLLQDFGEKGGVLTYETGETFPLRLFVWSNKTGSEVAPNQQLSVRLAYRGGSVEVKCCFKNSHFIQFN